MARIATLIHNMMEFWKSPHGWAPFEAAELLNKSMLEWQSSLARSLSKWTGPLSDGELILAWANIGALVEGQLKLFLSAYYNDYVADAESIKRNGIVQDPDGVSLEPLRVFFSKRIWSPEQTWDAWILQIQQRRNAIHAFKAKDIGTSDELHAALRTLLLFIRDMNSMLPYPEMYEPSEYEYQR
ncbi:hypothetical protein [Pseudomonas siliginis]|uniref:hypothetical protein n=1 Tax=Pseudomonas siliginis TaxID=2842346 RepID=UPI0020929E8C|nr:hypothetical protein [Pseudomonas siliginis]UST92750.1 hypothetical protein NF678_12780 [Pseudomonas siliginis]